MESNSRTSHIQLEVLALQRNSLRDRLALPGWYFVAWCFVAGAPAWVYFLPYDWQILGYVCGMLLGLGLIYYVKTGRGVRFSPPRKPFTRRDAAWLAVGMAGLAAVFGIAVAVSHPWPLLVANAVGVAMAAWSSYRHRREFSLRDETS